MNGRSPVRLRSSERTASLAVNRPKSHSAFLSSGRLRFSKQRCSSGLSVTRAAADCSADCDKKFKADPAKYVEALKKQGTNVNAKQLVAAMKKEKP